MEASVSCLICNKNGAKSLQFLIPQISKQSQKHSLIVVDDFSTDGSLDLLSDFNEQLPHFKFQKASKDIIGKKLALNEGMQSIDTEWLILTDVDCTPNSDEWIQNMLSASGTKKIVLGYSPYQKEDGFLNKWIRFEAGITAIQYLSFALAGRPYMGVGRNVLYHKDIFSQSKLLESHYDFASGDDDLFINKLASKENVAVNIDERSWMYTKAEKTWKDYKKQKARHYSVAHKYKAWDIFALTLFTTSWILFYLLLIVLLFSGHFLMAFIFWIIRMASTYIQIVKIFPKLGLEDCFASWWYLDILTVVYYLYFSIFTVRRSNQNF